MTLKTTSPKEEQGKKEQIKGVLVGEKREPG